MKVLITGGTGTISSGLVKESVNRGYETYAITRGTNNKRNILGANYLHADIWDTENVSSVLGNLKFDVVVECLAYGVEQLKISLNNFSKRCSQYVFISTAGIYNRLGENRIKESDPKEFIDWSYTRNKIECEKYLVSFSDRTGLKYTIVRPTVTYGDYRIPFPIATRTPGWTFFDRMKSGQIMLASDNVKFSIIHIDDFSNMVVSLFGNEKAMNEDFHIASNDNDIYWDDVIRTAGEILNVEPKIVHVSPDVIKKVWPHIYDELAYNKNLSLVLDDSKIKRTSAHIQTIKLKEGLERTKNMMYTEYLSNDCMIDKKWNDFCNAVIFYSYKNHYLNEIETQMVKKYIDNYGRVDFEESIKRVMRSNKKEKLAIYVWGIKKHIKNILKDRDR